jgi:hypothetical protein
MRTIFEQLAVSLAVAFVVLAVADSSAVLLGAVATLAVIALVGSRYSAVSIRSRSLTVGSRARQHRESMSSLPAPSHPDTAGRTRSRAPSQSIAAA